jgi:beta-1,2-mannobiose phosphorylase / 1,2-beta-oligomannan phosphorylase
MVIKRSNHNPILSPDPAASWEAVGAYNPTVVMKDGKAHALYRAVAPKQKVGDMELEISSIGHAVSKDGVHFENRKRLVLPQHPWERYGSEDPRVTEFEGRYFIFYTAVQDFNADGIKVAVAITRDFETIEERHLVTPFNAKAMALFPERVNGKIAAILTVHTDKPPARVCLALFDRIEDIWSEAYWKKWYAEWESHAIPLEENFERDQIEVGSQPIKTKNGWLIFYSYIYNYFSPPAIFGIQAALLDINNPQKIVGEVKRPFLIPEEEYEHYGRVPHIVFPSGAMVVKKEVYLYYGAADTVSCLAILPLAALLDQLVFTAERQLARFSGNPILVPIKEHPWESKAVFNPAAIYEKNRVHILYRAMGEENTSVMGYAVSRDGLHVDERLGVPIYGPRESFEAKLVPGGNSGCEDPRVTRLGDRIYMCYTAYNGKDVPRVAFTSINVDDFSRRDWKWSKPVLISPPGLDDKDAVLFPKKIKGKYWFLHRLGSDIWIDSVDDLAFDGTTKFLGGKILMRPRDTAWDSRRIGGTSPPIETDYGWLCFYHGISKRTGHYNVRAALLDRNDPTKVLYRTHDSLLEPVMPYEKNGMVSNVVFPCGAVLIKDILHVYYGGADSVVGVATIDMQVLIEGLVREAKVR